MLVFIKGLARLTGPAVISLVDRAGGPAKARDKALDEWMAWYEDRPAIKEEFLAWSEDRPRLMALPLGQALRRVRGCRK